MSKNTPTTTPISDKARKITEVAKKVKTFEDEYEASSFFAKVELAESYLVLHQAVLDHCNQCASDIGIGEWCQQCDLNTALNTLGERK